MAKIYLEINDDTLRELDEVVALADKDRSYIVNKSIQNFINVWLQTTLALKVFMDNGENFSSKEELLKAIRELLIEDKFVGVEDLPH